MVSQSFEGVQPQMRLVHTADVQLDMSYAGVCAPPGFGDRRRAGLRAAFERVLNHCRSLPADALLVAGNLFDKARVTRETLAWLTDALAGLAPVPVFIAPGNLDPYTADSPYATLPWPDNVHLFSSPGWTSVEAPGGPLTVHGFAFDGPDISANPFGRLRVPTDGRVHVAVGHGVESRLAPAARKVVAPFEAGQAGAPGLRYLALGHSHAAAAIQSGPPTVMYYSGAPEGHGFDEPGSHGFLDVEIGEAVVVHERPSAGVEFAEHMIDCSAVSTVRQLTGIIEDAARSSEAPLIARLTLTGAAPPQLAPDFGLLYDQVSAAFEYLELLDATEPIEDYAALANEQTTLGAVIARMNDELDNTPDPDRATLVRRSREVGLAAFRSVHLPVHGKSWFSGQRG